MVILGKGVYDLNQPSETDKVRQMILEKLGTPIQTAEARILAKGVDQLPQEQREMALNVVRAMFAKYSDYFDKQEDGNDT